MEQNEGDGGGDERDRERGENGEDIRNGDEGMHGEERRNGDENMFETQEQKPLEKLKPHAQAKLLSATDKCKVCNEAAAKHVHYGAMTCFSCRAFFRRSIQNKTACNYVCRRNKNCAINLKTRKNCQYCRYKQCLTAGMKPNWVLSDDERRKRFKKFKGTYPENEGAKNNQEEDPAPHQEERRKKKVSGGKNRCRDEDQSRRADPPGLEEELGNLALHHKGPGMHHQGPHLYHQRHQETHSRRQEEPQHHSEPHLPHKDSHQENQMPGLRVKTKAELDSQVEHIPRRFSTDTWREGELSHYPPLPLLLYSRQFHAQNHLKPRRRTFPIVRKEQSKSEHILAPVPRNILQQNFSLNQVQERTIQQQQQLAHQSRMWYHQQQEYHQHLLQQQKQRCDYMAASCSAACYRPGVIVHPWQVQQREQQKLVESEIERRKFLSQQPGFVMPIINLTAPASKTGSWMVEEASSSSSVDHSFGRRGLDEGDTKHEAWEEEAPEEEVKEENEDSEYTDDSDSRSEAPVEVILQEPEITFSDEEQHVLDDLITDHDGRYKSVNFGEELIKELIMSSMFGIPLSTSAAMSGYKLCVERITRIAHNRPEFTCLSSDDQSTLLKENADLLVSLRAAVFFDCQKKGVDQVLISMGIDDMDAMKAMFKSLPEEKEMKHINYKTCNSIQTINHCKMEDRNTFLQKRVAELIPDSKSIILITYIILFSCDFCKLNDQPAIQKTQDRFIMILKRYIYSRSCRTAATSILARALYAVTCIRELADIKKQRQICQNVKINQC